MKSTEPASQLLYVLRPCSRILVFQWKDFYRTNVSHSFSRNNAITFDKHLEKIVRYDVGEPMTANDPVNFFNVEAQVISAV